MQIPNFTRRIGLIARKRRTTQLQFRGTCLTDRGCQRVKNEDAVNLLISDTDSGSNYTLAIVADGMGGHAAGELASTMTVETISKKFADQKFSCTQDLYKACCDANDRVWSRSLENAQYVGMGTTCTAMVCHGQTMFFVHVGDSRIYQWRKGSLYQLSQDHTLHCEMMTRNQELAVQIDPNILSRALGVQATVEFQASQPMRIKPGDRYLLCSDGLHDLISDQEIDALLSLGKIDLATEIMMSLAKSRGGHDNISLIIVEVLSIH